MVHKSSRFPLQKKYWHAYGGVRALVKSIYLWSSVILTVFCFSIWTNPNAEWWDLTFAIIPNLLGFTLGGYAVWLAIGDERYREFLAEKRKNKEVSPYVEMNACFVHFIIVQFISIVLALFAYAVGGFLILDFIGFLTLVYALSGSVAITFSIFAYALVYDARINAPKDEKSTSDQDT